MLRLPFLASSAGDARLLLRAVALLVFSLATVGLAGRSFAQQSNLAHPVPDRSQAVILSDNASIEELIGDRIKQELASGGLRFRPAIVQTEADYVRLSASSKDEVLYEASFHLQPHYYYHATTGPDTNLQGHAEQPVMYYVGTARTPLALPVVSNLSKALPSDEASYTVNIGVLPLPPLSSISGDSGVSNSDSLRYYVVIERTIESNHTDNSVRMEQFHKDCSAKTGQSVNMRLANERLVKGAVVKLENGDVLDFDDDFSRYIEEHILLESQRLVFRLGHETVSDISERLSIPYSVARTCLAKVELLSVVDTAHSLTVLDTLRQPADYLAEVDMSKFADGPYRYRYTAIEPESGKVLFSETKEFNKTSSITVNEGTRIGSPDTLVVGRKKLNMDSLLSLNEEELANERVINERTNTTLENSKKENKDLEQAILANQKSTIADVHGRVGIGFGVPGGDNIFIGIESNRPALSFDVSFGWLGGSAPYLDYTHPANFSQIFSSPKSLGFQLQYIPLKFWNGGIEGLVGLGYYGIWSQPAVPGGLGSVALLSGQIGIASEPFGEVHGLGFSLSYGLAYDLAPSLTSVPDWSFKMYLRF